MSQIVKLIKPGLIRRNPLDIGAIWQSRWKRNRMLDTARFFLRRGEHLDDALTEIQFPVEKVA